jgi:hypothetical protein
MLGIAKLLFGQDAAGALEEFGDDGWNLAERARRSGEWCGSTPGHGAPADVLRGTAAGRPGRRGGLFGERGR